MEFSTNPINNFLQCAEILYSKLTPIFFRHDTDIKAYFLITSLLLPEHLQINYCTYHTSYVT